MRRALSACLSVAALALAGYAQAQEARSVDPHAPPPSASPPGSRTISTRDPQEQKWIDDPHIHAFYALAVKAFAGGADKVDVDAFEKQSFVLFREMAVSWGANPDAMQDHLKLIPRQVVNIAREDPKALATYENFTLALLGPP